MSKKLLSLVLVCVCVVCVTPLLATRYVHLLNDSVLEAELIVEGIVTHQAVITEKQTEPSVQQAGLFGVRLIGDLSGVAP
jgi:hypothetical protein